MRCWPHFFTLVGSYICANFGENRSRNATVRVHTDGMTDVKQFYNSSHAILATAMGQKWNVEMSTRQSAALPCWSVHSGHFSWGEASTTLCNDWNPSLAQSSDFHWQAELAVFGLTTWNSVPRSQQARELSLSTFERLLKTYLFQHAWTIVRRHCDWTASSVPHTNIRTQLTCRMNSMKAFSVLLRHVFLCASMPLACVKYWPYPVLWVPALPSFLVNNMTQPIDLMNNCRRQLFVIVFKALDFYKIVCWVWPEMTAF